MLDKKEKLELTHKQAQELLSPVGKVSVENISLSSGINRIFRVTTTNHGVFYIKHHTAFWYVSEADSDFAVERAAAVYELLCKRGIKVSELAWADTSKNIIPYSVFISKETAGIVAQNVFNRRKDVRSDVLKAIGHFLRRLHDIEFSNPGTVGPRHAKAAKDKGRVPYVEPQNWIRHPTLEALYQPDIAHRLIAHEWDGKKSLLPPEVAIAFEMLFRKTGEVISPDYSPPRFTVGNLDAWHINVDDSSGDWKVTGFYDFEEVCAGGPTVDILDFEFTLTPRIQTLAWREPFFEGYGCRPDFEGYKTRLLFRLLGSVGNSSGEWFENHWMRLLEAKSWDELIWFPEKIEKDE
jgi:hypothetical protein